MKVLIFLSFCVMAIFIIKSALAEIAVKRGVANVSKKVSRATTLENWMIIYYHPYANEHTKRVAEKMWDDLALAEVLKEDNLDNLFRIKSGRIRKGSIAEKASKTRHEELSLVEVTLAQNDIARLEHAIKRCPNGPARELAYKKMGNESGL